MHPVLEILRQQFYCDDPSEKEASDLVVGTMVTKHNQEYIGCHLSPQNDRFGTIVLSFYAFSRYQITSARNKKYFEHLQARLAETNLVLKIDNIRSLSISGRVDRQIRGRFCSWEEMAQATGWLIGQVFDVLTLVVLTTHVNARLSDLGGTERYTKVLPSRLAELTLCGYTDGASMH